MDQSHIKVWSHHTGSTRNLNGIQLNNFTWERISIIKCHNKGQTLQILDLNFEENSSLIYLYHSLTWNK
ncbi:hypothetical protein VNO80_30627 [Phaseolus coccineus]|uniref:Uncharacterized protein n=1 Tax=Phaseolus coccineus TaxID=3886 RepID=A0AAN9LI60_PHACN